MAGNRKFESVSLQRRVACEPEPGAARNRFRRERRRRRRCRCRSRWHGRRPCGSRNARSQVIKLLPRGALYLMLQNRLYRREIVHNERSHLGEHEPIIDRPLWDAVQAQLAGNLLAENSKIPPPIGQVRLAFRPSVRWPKRPPPCSSCPSARTFGLRRNEIAANVGIPDPANKFPDGPI